jgi:D-serine dehydratase
MDLNLAPLLADPLPLGTKGLPPRAAGLTLGQIGSQGWNVLRGELPLPVAVLKEEALAHNLRVMHAFAASTRARLAPHGKTTMSPQLFQMQLAHGAWAMTAATVSHVALYRRFGVSRILLANQLVDPVAIEYVLDELERDPEFELLSLADSREGVDRLSRASVRRGSARPLQLLLEAGAPGGRAGLRTVDEMIELARHIKSAPGVELRGVEAFEGVLSISGNPRGDNPVRALLDRMKQCIARLEELDLLAPGRRVVSAGGSALFEYVAHELGALDCGFDLVLRSGCYLTLDHGLYQRALEDPSRADPAAVRLPEALMPALEIWAHVQSRPERELAIAAFGKRDASYDAGLPVPIAWFRPDTHAKPAALGPDLASVTALNDQHAYLKVKDDHPLATGDLVCFGISHPCTTFDKWQLLYRVNADYDVTGGIRTFF